MTLEDFRAWLTLVAALVGASTPIFVFRYQKQQENRKFIEAWRADFSDAYEARHYHRVIIRYDRPDDPPASLISIEVEEPRNAKLAMVERSHNLYGDTLDEPSVTWSTRLDPAQEMRSHYVFEGMGNGVHHFDYSKFELFALMPEATGENDRTKLSMRLTVERISPTRDRQTFTVTTNETALKAKSDASAT